jgi:hypothetical protein
MNFHIVSAYNSEISAELSELARKKFGIIRILRMSSEFFFELSELTSEKNLELSEYSE